MESNRRLYPRSFHKVEFNCYVDGERFDTHTLNVSRSGAFLETSQFLADGTSVMISLKPKSNAPVEATTYEIPVLFFGVVVHWQEGPTPGIGLRWLRCLSRTGFRSLCSTLAFVLDIPAEDIPLPPQKISKLKLIEYDFLLQEFQPGREVGQAWSPPRTKKRYVLPEIKKTSARIPDSKGFDHDEDAGALSRVLSTTDGMLYHPTRVKVTCDDSSMKAVVHSIGTKNLYLATPGTTALPALDVSIYFPISTKMGKLVYKIVGRVKQSEKLKDDKALGYLVEITSLPKNPELWKRYVKFQFQKMLTEPEA